MNNTVSLSRVDLQHKLDEINSQIKNLEKDKEHLEYFLREFFNSSQISLFQEKTSAKMRSGLDSSLSTKPLIVQILKREGKEMTWNQVYDALHQVKPHIGEATVRVSLSQLNTDENKPVKLIQRGDKYTYVYDEK